jgi:simple sugar transport system ATP-binding protein
MMTETRSVSQGGASCVMELVGISKDYRGMAALKGVSLSLLSGRILCLLGENGAGKSTLIKLITGVERLSGGSILVDAEPVHFDSPRSARQRGISTVYQEVGTLPLMSVARNFVLGAEPTRGRGLARRVDFAEASRIATETMSQLGIRREIDGKQLVGTLSGGERQALAIMRAVYFGARVLVLDEPTAALGIRESALVLELLLRVKEQGVAVLFVTHNAYHAAAVGDQFVVLRRGEVIADFGRDAETVDKIMQLMAGGDELSQFAMLANERLQ